MSSLVIAALRLGILFPCFPLFVSGMYVHSQELKTAELPRGYICLSTCVPHLHIFAPILCGKKKECKSHDHTNTQETIDDLATLSRLNTPLIDPQSEMGSPRNQEHGDERAAIDAGYQHSKSGCDSLHLVACISTYARNQIIKIDFDMLISSHLQRPNIRNGPCLPHDLGTPKRHCRALQLCARAVDLGAGR